MQLQTFLASRFGQLVAGLFIMFSGLILCVDHAAAGGTNNRTAKNMTDNEGARNQV